MFIDPVNISIWFCYFFIGLALLPIVICILYYFLKERGHDFEVEIHDMQYQCELRMKKKGISYHELPFIDGLKCWDQDFIVNVKLKLYIFMKHFTNVQPYQYKDDFPQPAFKDKLIDPFNLIGIQLFTALSISLGLFSFYLQYLSSIYTK